MLIYKIKKGTNKINGINNLKKLIIKKRIDKYLNKYTGMKLNNYFRMNEKMLAICCKYPIYDKGLLRCFINKSMLKMTKKCCTKITLHPYSNIYMNLNY